MAALEIIFKRLTELARVATFPGMVAVFTGIRYRVDYAISGYNQIDTDVKISILPNMIL